MRISWVILTYNRNEIVNHSVTHNLKSAGRTIDQIIWVDNGSHDPDPPTTPNIVIMHENNLGVAIGYNHGMVMATGDYIVITGCDRLMPHNWLKTYMEYMEAIPNTGIISTYSKPISEVPERMTSQTEYFLGYPIRRAIPMEARIMSLRLQREIGYFHEGLGLYGWEDVLWSERAEKVTKELGLINYIIPGQIAEHLGSEGIDEWNGKDDPAYHAFKKKESSNPAKQVIVDDYRKNGHPYYNPYL